MQFDNEKFFLEDKKSLEKLSLFKKDYENYLKEPSKVFKNKDWEKCLKGFIVAYYHHYGLVYEPIIFNIDKGIHVVDYDKMNLYTDQDKQKYNKFKKNPYIVLENFCFIFHDGKQKQEFFFEDKKHIYNQENKEIFLSKLKELFFIKPFSEQLELDLQEKVEPKRSHKI